MLTAIAPDLWIADGPSVPFLGVPYPTRMTLVRLRGGALWLCSPIQLTEALAAAVEAIGSVNHLVSPNKLHHLFLGEWKQRWPAARLYAPPGLARRRRDLHFDAALGDTPDPAWAADVDQVIFRGSLVMDEVVFFHRASRTVIFTDLIQRFDPATVHGWRAFYLRLDGLMGPDGSTPREWRLTFINRRALRRAKATALSWAPERIVVAHGQWVRERGREVLERALRWMG